MNMGSGWFALVLCIAGMAVAAGATWAGCRKWYGRKITAAAQRLHKSDQGRLLSQQQTMQARRQIEQLRAEIEVLRKRGAVTQTQQERAVALERALAEAEHAIELDRASSSRQGAHGFADTQILP